MTTPRELTMRRRLLLTVAEVAELTGWGAKDLYKRGPSLPGYVKVGRSVRFRAIPLMRWLNADGEDAAEDGLA